MTRNYVAKSHHFVTISEGRDDLLVFLFSFFLVGGLGKDDETSTDKLVLYDPDKAFFKAMGSSIVVPRTGLTAMYVRKEDFFPDGNLIGNCNVG